MKKTTICMSILALIFAASSCTKGCKAEQKVEEPVAEEAPAGEVVPVPAGEQPPVVKEEAPAQPEGHEGHGHDEKVEE